MGDLLIGADSVDDAIHKRNAIHSTLERAYSLLRKYISNSSDFLCSLDPSIAKLLNSQKLVLRQSSVYRGFHPTIVSDGRSNSSKSSKWCSRNVQFPHSLRKSLIRLGLQLPTWFELKSCSRICDGNVYNGMDDPIFPELKKKSSNLLQRIGFATSLPRTSLLHVTRHRTGWVFWRKQSHLWFCRIHKHISHGSSILVCAKS